MKTARKTTAWLLAVLMVLAMLPLSARAADDTVKDAAELAAALGGAISGDTITLGDDIEYHTDEDNVSTITPIKIEGKTITFDLNGYTLDVQNETGYGLEVGAGGVVNVTGIDEDEGNEFSVMSKALFSAGVYAHDGGKATVSWASGTFGVVAGDISGDDTDGGEVTVLDGVWGAVYGVMAAGAGSNVTVNGSLYVGEEDEDHRPDSATGIAVRNGGTATINGNLEVYAENSAMGVEVEGTASATVWLNGMVYVEGASMVEDFIQWNDDSAAGSGGGAADGNYLRYTDGATGSSVYVIGACLIGSTVYPTFSDAWGYTYTAPAGSPITVKLLRDIDHYVGLEVTNKTVIFDLNGHELYITAKGSEENGLEVGANGTVNIIDSSDGEGYSSFYTNSSNSYGVYAHDGGRAAVTNAGGLLGGVLAESDSSVHVKGWAFGVNVGVAASGGGTVTVDDYINVSGYGKPYILLGGTAKSASDGVPGAASYEEYLVYSDVDGNTVRVKTDAVCKLSLTIPYDEETFRTFVTLHDSLEGALDETESTLAGWSATITLFEDIEYDTGITITNGTLTFNLNGHTLDVETDDGHGLYVGRHSDTVHGVVTIVEEGEFNVKSADPGCCGVVAVNGGQATVTNASSSNGTAAGTEGGGRIVVTGNVIGRDGIGAHAGSEVIVHGNVTALGAGGCGVSASEDGLAVIDGTITVQSGGVYIELFDGEDFLSLGPGDGKPIEAGVYKEYLHYTDGASHVYVKASVGDTAPTGSGSSATPTTPSAPEKKPGQPVTGSVSITATAGTSGTASATISDKEITDAIAKAQADAKTQGKTANGISVELNVTMPQGTTSLTTILTENSLNSLVSAGVTSLEISGAPVFLGLDLNALKEIQKQSDGNVSITITPATGLSAQAQALLGNRPVYEITISYIKDGNTVNVTSLSNGTATLSIPYTPREDEAVGCLFGVYVDANGRAIHIDGSAYDANAGAILISTGHFSVYGVGYTAPSARFTDIGAHWGKEAIDYAVGRGLLSGTSETTFAPNTAMTRGMLVTALGRLAGADVKAYTTNSFTDVKSDSAFRPYIEWAYKKGIVQGVGNQQFAPDRAVTREEIAVIFANYANATGYKLPVTREATAYADAFGIDSIYKTAVTAMQQAGIMMGSTGNRFNPKAGATRAEASSMIHRYIKLTIDPATAQGWSLNDAGQWLYYKDGKPLAGTQTIDGVKYFFETTGVLKTGWIKDGDNWRHYSGNTMLAGWRDIGGKWYYFYADGALAKSTKVDGYEIGPDGVRKVE